MSEGFQEVLAGELVKFEEVGTKVEGQLTNYKTQKTPKGEGNVYEVRTSKGVVSFFAPKLLHDKLQTIKIGRLVKIGYEGMKKGNTGNEYKVFTVSSAEANAANLALVGLTADEGFDSTDL